MPRAMSKLASTPRGPPQLAPPENGWRVVYFDAPNRGEQIRQLLFLGVLRDVIRYLARSFVFMHLSCLAALLRAPLPESSVRRRSGSARTRPRHMPLRLTRLPVREAVGERSSVFRFE